MSACRPMIFTGTSVTAILAGTKLRTRRLPRLSKMPLHHGGWVPTTMGGDGYRLANGQTVLEHPAVWNMTTGKTIACPYEVGDRLWVKETWRPIEQPDGTDGVLFAADGSFRRIDATMQAADQWVVAYDNGRFGSKWRSSMFMPRWASRLTLEVTAVHAEFLHDITEDEARLEGCDPIALKDTDSYREGFARLWRKLHGRNDWETNPIVWAISFKRLSQTGQVAA